LKNSPYLQNQRGIDFPTFYRVLEDCCASLSNDFIRTIDERSAQAQFTISETTQKCQVCESKNYFV
jgi:hypothetical protein